MCVVKNFGARTGAMNNSELKYKLGTQRKSPNILCEKIKIQFTFPLAF